MRRVGFVLLVWLLCPGALAIAQTIEIGGSLSSACRGSGGSTCGTDHSAVLGAFASLWLDDRVEIRFRVAQGGLDDRRFEVPRDGRFKPGAPDRVTVFLEDRHLRYVTTSASYHFLRGRRVRPSLGVGVGTFKLPRRQRCAPSGCEDVLPLLAGPPEAPSTPDLMVTCGLSVRASSRLTVHAGWAAHNPLAESLSSTETFVGLSWRLR
jgi:hypothetical protein